MRDDDLNCNNGPLHPETRPTGASTGDPAFLSLRSHLLERAGPAPPSPGPLSVRLLEADYGRTFYSFRRILKGFFVCRAAANIYILLGPYLLNSKFRAGQIPETQNERVGVYFSLKIYQCLGKSVFDPITDAFSGLPEGPCLHGGRDRGGGKCGVWKSCIVGS